MSFWFNPKIIFTKSPRPLKAAHLHYLLSEVRKIIVAKPIEATCLKKVPNPDLLSSWLLLWSVEEFQTSKHSKWEIIPVASDSSQSLSSIGISFQCSYVVDNLFVDDLSIHQTAAIITMIVSNNNNNDNNNNNNNNSSSRSRSTLRQTNIAMENPHLE